MNIPKKIAELRQMLIAHQAEMGYHIFDEVLMILAWLNKRVDDNSTECFSLIECINKTWPDPPQEELRPCPFCGYNDIIENEQNGRFFCECTFCRSKSADCYFKYDAIKKWNRRSNA